MELMTCNYYGALYLAKTTYKKDNGTLFGWISCIPIPGVCQKGVHGSCWNMDKHSKQNLHYANFVSKRYLVSAYQLKSVKTQRVQKRLYVEVTGKVCKNIFVELSV